MIRKLLATCAAASLISLPALAQTLSAQVSSPQATRTNPDLLGAPAMRTAGPLVTPGSDLPSSSMPTSAAPTSQAPANTSAPRADLPRDAAPTMAAPPSSAPALGAPSAVASPRAEAGPPPLHISDITVAPPAAPGDLAPGARVLDPAGDELGQVVSVTQAKPREHLQAFCILQRQGVTVALPLASLRLADGALTARETRAEVWGSP